MAIRISKNRIRATGSDANGLFIAMSPDATLLEWDKQKHGSEEFQRMVKEAISARGLHSENVEVSGPPPMTPECKQSATGGFAAPNG